MELAKLLDAKINSCTDELNSWFDSHLSNILIPLYSSVDLRVSDYKIAPVDTNIFPAGFNNLSEEFRDIAGELFRKTFEKKYPKAKNILIVPELHTKNAYYWENILTLKLILERVDFEVRVGVVNDEFSAPRASFETKSGSQIDAFKTFNEDHKLQIDGFVPEIVLINNDFSEKCPQTLRDIVQPVVPPVEMGWHTRRKNVHFEFYNSLAREVSEIMDIDPGAISIETCFLDNVDFDDLGARKKVAKTVDEMLVRLNKEYLEKDIKQDPFVFIKSNSGTYGMAVMSTKNPEEILMLNANSRKKMRVTKGGIAVRDIVVQEGVPTVIKNKDGVISEPVLYMVESNVAGAFYRSNNTKSQFENLNSRGMEFNIFERKSILPAYSLIARIASVASGYEIEKIIKEGGCKEAAS